MIKPNELNFFKQQGYIIVQGSWVTSLKSKIKMAMLETSIAMIEMNPGINIEKSDEIQLLMDNINIFENTNGIKISSKLYEILPKHHALMGLLNDQNIIEVCKSLGIKIPIAATVPVCRIDRPNNLFYNTPLHQDGWYTLFCETALTVWIPISSIVSSIGPLKIIPASHTQGLLPFQKFTNGYEPFIAKNSDLMESDLVEVLIADDEILIFNQYLLHQSGENQSSNCRISIQLRFNDFSMMKEAISTFQPIHSKAVIDKQNELLKSWDAL